VPVPDARRLARACAGLGLRGHVVPTPTGAVVVPDAALLAGSGEAGSALDEAAPRLSRVLGRRAPLLVLTRADGRLEAQRWQGGALVDTPAAGLLAQTLPDAVTDLLVGSGRAADAPGAVEIGVRARPTGAQPEGSQASGGVPDGVRVARRRTVDRVGGWVVGVLALVWALFEATQAVAGRGSWVAAALAALVGVVMVLVALRAGRGGAPTGDGAPGPGS
jgi:hypothetical protein